MAPGQWLIRLSGWGRILALSVCLAADALAQVVPPDPPLSFPPHVGGEWSPILVWPHVPVSMASLPDGRILTFASNERNRDFSPPQDEYTYAAVWDPGTGTIKEVPHPNHDMFCAALVMTETGEPFVMGGRNRNDSPWTSYYDFRADRWVQIEDMNRGRWYPTAVYLGGADAVFIAAGDGGGVHPEVWRPGSGWTLLTGVDLTDTILADGLHDGSGQWPLLHLAPDGTVFHHGATPTMNTIDPFGGPNSLGTISDLGPHGLGWYPDEGVSVLYDEGKILVAGGSLSVSDDTAAADAWRVDINGPAPLLTPTGSMHYPRQFLNEVVLPTGDVVAIGGNTTGIKATDALAVKNAEAWSPATDAWTLWNGQDQARPYHSVAVLMTDGRVISAGGGLNGESCANPEAPGECGNDHWNAEIFSPPYLFDPDDTLATRPVIQSGPGVARVGTTITVQATPGLTAFSMIRMAATTHTMNTDQRYLAPSFTETSPGTYEIVLHANPNVAVPGYWMLFGLDGQVPSVAHVFKVVNDGTPRGEPIAGLRHSLGTSVLVQIDAEDPDGNPLTFSATGLPPGLSIDATTGIITGTATATGVYDARVTAFDGSEAGLVTFPWTVSTVRSEVGTVTVDQPDRSVWHAVAFSDAFQDPIVVMGPSSRNDPAPATVRVRNVTPTGFEFLIEEWNYQDGTHASETLSYLVVEKGEYVLGGSALVADRTTGVDFGNPRMITLPPGAFTQTPLVLAQGRDAERKPSARLPDQQRDDHRLRAAHPRRGGREPGRSVRGRALGRAGARFDPGSGGGGNDADRRGRGPVRPALRPGVQRGAAPAGEPEHAFRGGPGRAAAPGGDDAGRSTGHGRRDVRGPRGPPRRRGRRLHGHRAGRHRARPAPVVQSGADGDHTRRSARRARRPGLAARPGQ